MSRAARRHNSMTEVLRAAIVVSGVPYKALERETGVTRASVMRFVRGSQSIRLDMADKLAAYFDLVLTPARETRKE